MRTIFLLLLALVRAVSGTAAESLRVSPFDQFQLYEQWQASLENTPHSAFSPLIDADRGPVQKQQALRGIYAIGPDFTPTLVEAVRFETNEFRLRLAFVLLDQMSGINMIYAQTNGTFSQWRDQLIGNWDSWEMEVKDEMIRPHYDAIRKNRHEAKVVPAAIVPLRRFGIFGVPFLIDRIQEENSAEAFAAFLIIATYRDLYADYIEQPRQILLNPEDKLAVVREWFDRQGPKIKSLGSLEKKIRASLKLPQAGPRNTL